MSVERSQQLIANVAKMPPQAQAHPQVQADLAQAQSVVAQDTAARQPQADQNKLPDAAPLQQQPHSPQQNLQTPPQPGTASPLETATAKAAAGETTYTPREVEALSAQGPSLRATGTDDAADSGPDQDASIDGRQPSPTLVGAAQIKQSLAGSQEPGGRPHDVGASPEKTMSERQKENAELLVRRPTRKHAPSDKAQIVVKGLHGQILRKVALLTDHAHDDGSLPPFVLGDEVRGPNSEGEYLNGVASVRPDASQPLLTGLHEVGHHIATHILGAAAVQRIQDAARNTLTWERIIKRGGNLDYWTNAEEVFCRVYAQLVAVRSQNLEVLAELGSVLRNPIERFTQWPSHEFEGVRKVMEQELKKIGWL